MTLRHIFYKPLPGPMTIPFTDAYMRHMGSVCGYTCRKMLSTHNWEMFCLSLVDQLTILAFDNTARVKVDSYLLTPSKGRDGMQCVRRSASLYLGVPLVLKVIVLQTDGLRNLVWVNVWPSPCLLLAHSFFFSFRCLLHSSVGSKICFKLLQPESLKEMVNTIRPTYTSP